MSIGDALWWAAGAALLLGGLVATHRALFRDRARGRLRCPRCWYRMEGRDDLRCPECGRDARYERRLRRTRRHWRVAALGATLVAGALAVVVTRQVQRHGWLGSVPNVVYVVFLPELNSAQTSGELMRRVAAGELRQWEYRLLVRRGLGVLEARDDPPRMLLTLYLFGRIEDLGYRHESGDSTRPWKSWARVSRIDGERTLRALVALLDHEDRSLRRTAASAIGSFRAEARPAAAGLMGRLSTTDPAEFREIEDALVAMSVGAPDALEFPRGVVQSPRPRDEGELRSFLDRLRFCATDSAGALPLFVEGLESDDDGVRALSVCGAALFGSEDEAVRARVLDLENDRWKPVRRTVVQATSRFPLDERVIGAVTRALRGSRPENADAARVVALRGPAGAPFLPEVAARLDHGEAFVQAYRAIGGDDDVAVRAVLRDGLESGYVNAIISCLERVGRLGAPSAEGRRRVEPFLEDRDPRVRAAAAFAAAACGGDLAEPTRVILAEHASGVRTVPVYLGAMLEKRLLSEDVLLAMLDDPDPVERAEAARILGRLGAISALPRLREMRSDPDPIAAHNAGEAVNLVEHMPGRGTGERRASGR